MDKEPTISEIVQNVLHSTEKTFKPVKPVYRDGVMVRRGFNRNYHREVEGGHSIRDLMLKTLTSKNALYERIKRV